MKIDELDPSYFLINELVDSKLVGKLDDGELVNSELVDSQQQLNLHMLSFYS